MIQKDLGKVLVEELKEIGLADAEMDEWGYVFATIPNNTGKDNLPTICFCSHMDTAPDCSGTNVKPILHKNYSGASITLPDDHSQIITTDQHPYLKEKIGDDLITASGLTLLGADDKAGIAIIMDFAKYIIENPLIKHPTIRILFTPDEEVGRGVEHLDMQKLNADFGYTLDGGTLGSLEDESFSADAVKISVEGITAHPGYAKGKMINSILIANEYIAAVPENEVPEKTAGYEGFFHLHDLNGNVEKTVLEYIVRDHDFSLFEKRKELLQKIASDFNKRLHQDLVKVEIKNQYFNMKEKITPVMHIVDIVEEVMKDIDITPLIKPIRGGTDGSQLSYKGLPCPNIFAGGHNFHGRFEYIPAESMIKATEVIIGIAQKVSEKFK